MSVTDISRNEKYSRCVALEEDYVHQVYESIGKDLAQAKDPMQDTVRKFLDELEPGSLVADIGCGDGKHLRDKNGVFSIGAERSSLQASLARQRCQEVLLGDNLKLPFRNNVFDAVLSVEVLHHFTTKERRIDALKEISRVLKIGGRALITVQRHNNKISQDVLIPWFDVPKEKKVKESEWLEDNEYLYDCNKNYDEDEESLSLPSSDEEDNLCVYEAKFFPPKRNNEVCGQNFENATVKKTTASKNVPNKQQLVHNNACYTFVRRAFKKFSNDEQNDRSEFGCIQKLAVPLESIKENELNASLLNCSSFNMNESLLRTISENIIELLNMENEENTSKLNTSDEYDSEKFACKSRIFSSNRNTLIRSLSDIFKNINFFWSGKSTKSCFDLKSLGDIHDECIRNRLVRSRTTTTCCPELDGMKPSEKSQISDMTVSEANKIIHDLLDTSVSHFEPSSSLKESAVNKCVIQPDIVNGNLLPIRSSKVENLNSKEKLKCPKKKVFSRLPLLKEEEFLQQDTKFDLSYERNSVIFESENYDFYNKKTFLSESMQQLSSVPRNFSNYEYYNDGENAVNNEQSFLDYTYEREPFDRKLIEARLKKEYSFLYDDESDEDDEDDDIRENFDYYDYENKTVFSHELKYKRNVCPESTLIHDKNLYFNETAKLKTSEKRPLEKNYVVENSRQINRNKHFVFYENSFLSNETDNKFYEASADSNMTFTHFEMEDDMREFDCCICPGSSSSKCFLLNSPKKVCKENYNDVYQCSEINTLGPFYDEDNDCTYADIDFPLVSYYSMPELHAMTEFYEEYKLYQNYLDSVNPELLNYSYNHSKGRNTWFGEENSKLKIDISEKTDRNSRENISENENEIEISELQQKESQKVEIHTESEAKISQMQEKTNLKNSVLSESCIENMKRELCNNIQTAFTSTESTDLESKLNKISIPEIMFDNEKLGIPYSFQLKNDSFVDIDNKLISNLCSNNRRSNFDGYNSFIYFQSLGISRSCSSLLENVNLNKFVEIPSLTNISASQPSLKFSPKNDLRLNLNKNKLNQINLYHSLSSDILLDEDIFSNVIESTPEKDFYNKKNVCALEEIQNNSEPVRKINDILNNSSHEVSYISSTNSKETSKNITELAKTTLNTDVSSDIKILETLNNYKEKAAYDENISVSNDSHSIKLRNMHYENFHFMPVIENFTQYNEKSSSKETSDNAENYIFSGKIFKNGKQILQTNEISNEKGDVSEKSIDCSSDSKILSNKFGDTLISHENLFHLYPLHKNISCISNKSISECETQSVSLLVRDSIQSNNDDCSIDKILPTDDTISFDNTSPTAETSDRTLCNSGDSSCSEPIQEYFFDSVESERFKNSFQTTDIADEGTNYTYGKICDDNAAVVCHRYHHLFQEEELYDLIENNITDLHVLDTFVGDLHLCIIAEKVRVWTI